MVKSLLFLQARGVLATFLVFVKSAHIDQGILLFYFQLLCQFLPFQELLRAFRDDRELGGGAALHHGFLGVLVLGCFCGEEFWLEGAVLELILLFLFAATLREELAVLALLLSPVHEPVVDGLLLFDAGLWVFGLLACGRRCVWIPRSFVYGLASLSFLIIAYLVLVIGNSSAWPAALYVLLLDEARGGGAAPTLTVVRPWLERVFLLFLLPLYHGQQLHLVIPLPLSFHHDLYPLLLPFLQVLFQVCLARLAKVLLIVVEIELIVVGQLRLVLLLLLLPLVVFCVIGEELLDLGAQVRVGAGFVLLVCVLIIILVGRSLIVFALMVLFQTLERRIGVGDDLSGLEALVAKVLPALAIVLVVALPAAIHVLLGGVLSYDLATQLLPL